MKLAKPVFVVEPSGRYRASADLSLGRRRPGPNEHGPGERESSSHQFRASAQQLRGRHLPRPGKRQRQNCNQPRRLVSRITATFTELDVAGPFTAFAGAAVPLAGRANGSVDIAFPGTNFQQATGTINTRFTGQDVGVDGRVPLSGEVAVRADRGLFNIDKVDLQTPATKLRATGQFSFTADSNLQVDLEFVRCCGVADSIDLIGLAAGCGRANAKLRYRSGWTTRL